MLIALRSQGRTPISAYWGISRCVCSNRYCPLLRMAWNSFRTGGCKYRFQACRGTVYPKTTSDSRLRRRYAPLVCSSSHPIGSSSTRSISSQTITSSRTVGPMVRYPRLCNASNRAGSSSRSMTILSCSCGDCTDDMYFTSTASNSSSASLPANPLLVSWMSRLSATASFPAMHGCAAHARQYRRAGCRNSRGRSPCVCGQIASTQRILDSEIGPCWESKHSISHFVQFFTINFDEPPTCARFWLRGGPMR